jgi:hypothetical protein
VLLFFTSFGLIALSTYAYLRLTGLIGAEKTEVVEFKPGDFKNLYPKLIASDDPVDHQEAARLLLFYGDLLLREKQKYSGSASLQEIRIVQILLKEHAQRHPVLLTHFPFVLELLKRSLEVDDFATASAVFDTLQQTHPDQLGKSLVCFHQNTREAISEGEETKIETQIESCQDTKESMLLVIDYVEKLALRDGPEAAQKKYDIYRSIYADLPETLNLPQKAKTF